MKMGRAVWLVVALALTVSGCTGTLPPAGLPASTGSSAYPYPVPVPAQPAPAEAAPAATPAARSEPAPAITYGSGEFINRAAATPAEKPRAEGDITLNFDDIAIQDVVKVILGDILGENYAIEPGVKGSVTLKTSQPVQRDLLLPILEGLLKMNGAAMVWDGNIYRVVPLEAAVRSAAPPQLASRGGHLQPGYRVQIIPLRYIAAQEMMKILGPIVPKENILLSDPNRNLIVLAGTAADLASWQDTVNIFDVDWMSGYSVGVFPVQYAEAKTIADELNTVIAKHMNPDSAALIRIEALDRLNSVLVLTPQRRYLDEVRDWVERLDQVGDEPGVRLFVYPVKNRKAADLADVLSNVLGGESMTSTTRTGAPSSARMAPGLSPVSLSNAPAEGAPAAATPAGEAAAAPAAPRVAPSPSASEGLGVPVGSGVRIVADEANNTILVLASPQDFKVVEAALKKLDVVELQVLIEASILEVSLTDEFSFGLEWYFKNTNRLGGSKRGEALLDLSTGAGIGAIIPGFSYSVIGNDVINAVLNTLASESKLNVLSSPSLMVLDNRTARITVGDQVPVLTGTTVTDGGNTIQNIQFKDTGVQLEVTPRINVGGLITLDVRQEVTDVGNIDAATNQRSFRQRNIESTIGIQSGETIMLGGLITQNNTTSQAGIPGLSRVPVLGALFGTTGDTSRRTELVVLITPRVVRSTEEAREVTEEFRRRMHDMRRLNEPAASMTTGQAAPAAAAQP